MTTNTSCELNTPKYSWTATFRRSFTLRRRSKNTFTPNSENRALTDKIESIRKTATLERFVKKEGTLDGSALHLGNRAKTLGRIKNLKDLTALEQAKQCFTCPEQEDFNAENRIGALQETLISKASDKIIRELQLAKNSFQNESYKEAKKRFKKILRKPLNQERTVSKLYLATIYLLQDNTYKAREYLGKPRRFIKGDTISLEQAMYSHVIDLINRKEAPEEIKGLCLTPQLYGKAEGFSEDETIMAKTLYKKFCVSNS